MLHQTETGSSSLKHGSITAQGLLQKELDAQSERRDRAANRAEKLLKKLRQQRPQEAAALELDIELSQLQESNQALLQVVC